MKFFTAPTHELADKITQTYRCNATSTMDPKASPPKNYLPFPPNIIIYIKWICKCIHIMFR